VVKLGAIAIREVLRRAGLKPITNKELLEVAPDMFKWTGMTDLEKSHYQWTISWKKFRSMK